MHFKRVHIQQFSVCILSALLGVAPSGSLSVHIICMRANDIYEDSFVFNCLCIWLIECIHLMHPSVSAIVLVLEIATLVGHLPLSNYYVV